jgi:hypothetical protein
MNAYASTFNAIGETLDRIAHRADRDRRLAREEEADARDEVVIHALRATIAELLEALEEARMGLCDLASDARLTTEAGSEAALDVSGKIARAILAKARQP